MSDQKLLIVLDPDTGSPPNGSVTCTLQEFLEINDGLTPDEIHTLKQLQIGDHMIFGGGAAASFWVERVS